ncbi:Large ribosomal subunit protein bL33c [Trichinella pseudospiralis]
MIGNKAEPFNSVANEALEQLKRSGMIMLVKRAERHEMSGTVELRKYDPNSEEDCSSGELFVNVENAFVNIIERLVNNQTHSSTNKFN